MNTLHTIEELLRRYPDRRLWFFLPDDRAKRRFAEELNALRASSAGDEAPLRAEQLGTFMAFGADRRLTHISCLCWAASFGCAALSKTCLHIDYAKLHAGEDAVLRTSGLRPVLAVLGS